MKRRILNLLIAIDQTLFCLITLGHSDPDETMSAAAWRMERDGKFFAFMRPTIDWLFSRIEADHCRTSYEKERASR